MYKLGGSLFLIRNSAVDGGNELESIPKKVYSTHRGAEFNSHEVEITQLMNRSVDYKNNCL